MGGLRKLLERYKRKHAHEHNFETLTAFDDFPESNLQLAAEQTIEQLRKMLAEQNWTLEFPTGLH